MAIVVQMSDVAPGPLVLGSHTKINFICFEYFYLWEEIDSAVVNS